MKECPECGSRKIVKGAKLRPGESVLKVNVVVFEKPDALVFKSGVSSGLKAEICGDCGFLRAYAEEPRQLWSAYEQSISDVE